MDTKKKALIIGCGIAGPAAAIFLQRAGIEPVIYEAMSAHDDYTGLFLNVGRNGIRVLKELGADDIIRKEGIEMNVMRFCNGKGKALGELGQFTGEPQGYTVKRGLLQSVLRKKAERRNIPIHLGCKLVDIQMADDKVTAFFDNGTSVEGDFLVGCDGIHSKVRQMLLPDAAKPSYTGLISFGGYADNPRVLLESAVQQMVFGKRAFFGYLGKKQDEIFWFGNQSYPGTPTRHELEAIPQTEWRRVITGLYQDDAEPVMDIIRSTRGEIGIYPIYDMPTQPAWHSGSAVIIGDAIHATSPNAGQGASMALEDAMLLAKCVRDIDRIEQAFVKFQALRRERVDQIVQYSRSLGQRKHATNPIQVFFRDLMLPFFLKSANKDAHGWMYDYTIHWDERICI